MPEAVRVGEVQRLAHGVIGTAGIDVAIGDVPDEPAKHAAIGHQDREVEEPEPPLPRRRRRAGEFVQLDERGRAAVRRQAGADAGCLHDVEAEDVGVVVERAREVAHLQPDRADVGVVRAGDSRVGRCRTGAGACCAIPGSVTTICRSGRGMRRSSASVR